MRAPAFLAWMLLLAPALSGCLAEDSAPPPSPSPSSPAATPSAVPAPTTSAAPVGTGGPALSIELAVDPAEARSGQAVAFRAVATNPGPGGFTYAPCAGQEWVLRIAGPSGEPVHSTGAGSQSCPTHTGSVPPRTLAEGESLSMDFRWATWGPQESQGGWGHAPSGAYTATVSLHGSSATAGFAVLPAPTLEATLDRDTLHAGQSVTLRAVLRNPTAQPVHYRSDCAGAPWSFNVTTGAIGPDGRPTFLHEPAQPQGQCAGAAVLSLPPGQSIERSFSWNGTYQGPDGTWTSSDGYFWLNLAVRYGDDPSAPEADVVRAARTVYVS